MNKKIDKLQIYMDHLASHNYFNGSVLVAHKGEVLLKKGYGMASFQYGVPNTSSIKFRIGSLTKAFTAMAIMVLHGQGKLDIDDSIERILPDYPNGAIMTVRHLLNHASGIPSFTSTPDYWQTAMRLPWALTKVILSFKDLPLEFEPGTKMDYSNSGYLLLTAIVEQVSGCSYADFLKKAILDPLGLEETGVDNGRTIIRELASGHTVWGDVIHTEFVDMSFPLGAYGMYSTVEDLYTWCQALMNGTLVSDVLMKQMFTGVNGYGFGWFIENRVPKAISHFGDINGFVHHLMMIPDEELVVMALSNINITPVNQITSDLMKIALGKEMAGFEPFKVLELQADNLAGRYQNGDVIITIGVDQGLYTIVPKMYGVPYKFRLFPVKADMDTVICKSDYIHDTYCFKMDQMRRPLSVELTDAEGVTAVYKRCTEKVL
ncbi:serine hydrolase [Neobacillus mesonae]|uniref:serine hydrolase domain-containing protein n=1 Tax=Neobacillus mesonae TaxID=1193713 RepID=UPI00203BB38C|nr:serine hydrolase domain-containing protein [Neobacillus mesonae]MCM3570692.1 beta-lactamase family protein [Neobacillus mesonae]